MRRNEYFILDLTFCLHTGTISGVDKKYEHDYEEAMAALEKALHKREAVEREIVSLQKRVEALEVLMDKTPLVDNEGITRNRPWFGPGVSEEQLKARVSVHLLTPTVTERVRNLLSVVGGPLTCGEIHDKLKQLGVELREKTNPWALIHGICRRLVSQGFAREVDKDGRKAWMLAAEK